MGLLGFMFTQGRKLDTCHINLYTTEHVPVSKIITGRYLKNTPSNYQCNSSQEPTKISISAAYLINPRLHGLTYIAIALKGSR